MADGRLTDAQARYRDAIVGAPSRRARRRRRSPRARARAGARVLRAGGRAGSGRAAGAPRARRCCARWRYDPTTAVLKLAATPGGDLFFVPDGDVFYYLGLAAEAEGRDGDAEAAFREFLARRAAQPLGARRRRRTSASRTRRAARGRPPWPAGAAGGEAAHRRRTAPCWRRAASPRRSSTPPGATRLPILDDCLERRRAWPPQRDVCGSRSRWTSTARTS